LNTGEIAELFIRAAEIDRATPEHVGPSQPRSLALPYVHTHADKTGWGKVPGDQLVAGADPLAEERKAFWDRIGILPSAHEISELEILQAWLTAIDKEEERRALLAWARSKVGGKAFRRWCFKVEGIHPETGRRRKDRALAKISAKLVRSGSQNGENPGIRVLRSGPEIGHLSDTIAEDAGQRDGLNSWVADGAISPFVRDEPQAAFSWARKRNERRRKKEAARQKALKSGQP